MQNTNRLDDLTKYGYKKIIATTDTSLVFKIGYTVSQGKYNECFPQPSQQFIEKYVESYNAGNPITEVLVEYEEMYSHGSGYYKADALSEEERNIYSPLKELHLKVNPDNTITIKRRQDSLKEVMEKNPKIKEEVIELIRQFNFDRLGDALANSTVDNWIKENL